MKKIKKLSRFIDVGQTTGMVEMRQYEDGNREFNSICLTNSDCKPDASENSKSTNLKRGKVRGQRRNNERAKKRHSDLKKELKKIDMIESEKNIPFNRCPYEMRSRALVEPIDKNEMARIILNISKKRGYKSNKKEFFFLEHNDNEVSSEERGKVLNKIKKFKKELEKSNTLTIGQYLYNIIQDGKVIRNDGDYSNFLREDVIYEIELIYEKQREFFKKQKKEIPYYLSEEAEKKVKDILFFQRELRSKKDLVKDCSLEPEKKCCHTSNPIFEEFRMYSVINNLRFYNKDEDEIIIDEEQKQKIIELFYEEKTVTVTKIKKAVNDPDIKKINYKDDQDIISNNVNKLFIDIFGADVWHNLHWNKKEMPKDEPERIKVYKEDLYKLLFFATQKNDKDWLKNKFIEKYKQIYGENSEKEACEKVKAIDSFYTTTREWRYSNLSEKAIKKLLPYLIDGYDFYEAKEQVGYKFVEKYKKGSIKTREELNKLIRDLEIECTNYTVRKSVIPVIIDTYYRCKENGKIYDKIIVELARDLSLPLERIKELCKENRKREEWRKEARGKIQEIAGNNFTISDNDILKYMLWKECKETCVYTGNKLSLQDLFNDTHEVEHIIPYCRSISNNFNNLMICSINLNREKDNRTPYETHSSDKKYWKELKDRLRETIGKNNKDKQEIFLTKKVPKEFSPRCLNDTAYSAIILKKYLSPFSKKVFATNGKVTSLIREKLYKKKKDRTDLRHNMEDAFLSICATPYLIQKINELSKENMLETLVINEPWEGFLDDLERVRKNTLVISKSNKRVVSKRNTVVKKKGKTIVHRNTSVRGELHCDTFYSLVKESEDKKTVPIDKKIVSSICEIDSTGFTIAKIEKIADKNVKSVIKGAFVKSLNKLGVDFDINETITSKTPKASEALREVKNMAKNGKLIIMPKKDNDKVHPPIKRVRVNHIKSEDTLSEVKTNNNTFAFKSNNFMIVIYKDKDTSEYKEKLIRFDEAVESVQKKTNLFDDIKEHEIIDTISKQEMFLFDLDQNKLNFNDPNFCEKYGENLYRVKKISKGEYVFLKHYEANKDGSGFNISSADKFVKRKPIKIIFRKDGQIVPASSKWSYRFERKNDDYKVINKKEVEKNIEK